MRAYAVEGSPGVFINGRRVLRAGDGYDALAYSFGRLFDSFYQ